MVEKIKENKKELGILLAALIGVFGALAVISIFISSGAFMKLPIGVRAPLSFFLQWFIMLVPAMIMILREESFKELGVTNKRLSNNILNGVVIGLIMSAVLTLLPISKGFGDSVSDGHGYTKAWQLIYYFFYCIFAVALAEELVFRGYFFNRIDKIFGRKAAIAASSVLFGLFHIFGGGIVQIIMTALIGLALCICREKIKDCNIIALIIAHGLYDFLIAFWGAVL